MERDASHIPFVTTGSYPLRAGNAVRPLIDGEPAFRRICEAVESACQSVWVTIAFLDSDFAMPDGRGSLFDVLDRAAARGLDVRVLFWRHRELATLRPGTHFAGTAADLDFLRERDARWDQAHGNYCQHQKRSTASPSRSIPRTMGHEELGGRHSRSALLARAEQREDHDPA